MLNNCFVYILTLISNSKGKDIVLSKLTKSRLYENINQEINSNWNPLIKGHSPTGTYFRQNLPCFIGYIEYLYFLPPHFIIINKNN